MITLPRRRFELVPQDETNPDTVSNLAHRVRDLAKIHPEKNPTTNRPYGISAEQRIVLIDAIRAGNFFSTACELADVSYGTFMDWMQRGGDEKSESKYVEEHPVEPYKSFARDVRRAEAEGEAALIADIRAAGKVDWKANAWIASRRHNDRWAEQKGPIQIGTSGNVSIMLPSNNRDSSPDTK
jgi:hypothetical protein